MHDRDLRPRYDAHPFRPDALLAGAVVASAAVIGGHAMVLPAELVLPILSCIFIIAAFGIAAIALLIRSDRAAPGRITCWDVSGALYFFGCCAGVLAEPEGVLALMEEIKIRK